MKRKLISVLCLALVLAFSMSGLSLSAGALWLSPLAERGDVNNDGILQIADARLILRHAVDIVKLTPPQKWPRAKVFGDVNADKKVTIADARIVLRRAIGLPDSSKTLYNNDSEILFSGKYHIQATMLADGTESPFNIAIDGSNFYTSVDFEGIQMEFLLLDGKITLMNPNTSRYCTLTKSELSSMGLDVDDFVFDFDMGTSDTAPTLLSTENVTISGKEYTCYTYEYEGGGYTKHYRIDDKLYIVEVFDETDMLISKMLVDSISSDIESVLSIPSKYKSQSMMIFFLSYMENIL